MTPTAFFVILNPTAGRGRASREWQQAEAVFARAGVEYQVVRTARAGEGSALAEQAVQAGWPAVVAVGGDGTIHEVANGLARAAGSEPTLPVGIIGAGTGNDFIRHLNLPRHSPAEAARRLLAASPRRVDLGRVGSTYFVNGVGVGLDARVAIEAQRVPRLRGMAVYVLALLRALRSHSLPFMRVTVDGVEVAARPLTLVSVTNGACYGGGFWICPGAELDDGRLDVVVADELSRAGVLRFVPQVMRGTHVGRPQVHMYRACRVEVESEAPVAVQADGEILTEATREVAFEVWPARLTVLA